MIMAAIKTMTKQLGLGNLLMLALCITTASAQQVFIPSCKHITCDYHTFINSALDCDNSRAFFVCQPSFSNEYAHIRARRRRARIFCGLGRGCVGAEMKHTSPI